MSRYELIDERFKLFLKLMWLFFLLDIVIVSLFDDISKFVTVMVIFFIALLIFTWISYLIKSHSWNMYGSITFIYLFLATINIIEPYIVNLLFLLFPVVFSAIFQQLKLVYFSAIISVILQLYFFLKDYEIISVSFEKIDILYFLLFTLLTVLLLSYYLSFTNTLWVKVNRQNEHYSLALKTTQAQFDLIFSQTHDAIALLDKSGHVITVNPAFEKLYQMSKSDIVKKKYTFATRERLYLSVSEVSVYERHDFKSDGSVVEVEVTVSPIYDEDNELIAFSEIIRDVTEKRKQDQYMFQTEKLKLAGEMAAGVAHEIRNPITVLQGFLQLFHEKNHGDQKHTKIMLSELKRMNEIVSEFLVLSKPQAVQQSQFSIKEIIDETLQLFETEALLKGVQLEFQDNSGDLELYGDRNQIKQVIINLLKNACDAMPNGGMVHVEVAAEDQKYISIKVVDNGMGIPSDLLGKIQTPFFTTKEKGTGLGLVITEKIINQHNGELCIQSEEGEGTTVTIYLPYITSPALLKV
ncbi:ATP-binding protein [Metabacillus arenae]|uniref:histidine kinase n=1 Tax=Metabacillus arenae TaxID=2771434 RepID=A0A926S0H2_9BACI|nr:ATP-binding protein [Metabacillus arenae]MBD1383297.1 PAS domain S-box protein [Metabacillus arenae]